MQWHPGMKVDSVLRNPPNKNNGSLPTNTFQREEFEILASWNDPKRGDAGAKHMLQWASHPKYSPHHVRPLSMKTLHKKAVEENVPDGVMREDFTEPLDGAQTMMFYFRSMYDACKELLRNARFAGSQYIQAEVDTTSLGKRKLGDLNRGTMYETCQMRAGARVSPVPVFLSSDTTVVCKKMGGHPIICKYSACCLTLPASDSVVLLFCQCPWAAYMTMCDQSQAAGWLWG